MSSMSALESGNNRFAAGSAATGADSMQSSFGVIYKVNKSMADICMLTETQERQMGKCGSRAVASTSR